MSYYPKSQIKTNLYTNGDKFYIPDTSSPTGRKNYTGYYYEISSGDKFTGRNPGDGISLILTPIHNEEGANTLTYSNPSNVTPIISNLTNTLESLPPELSSSELNAGENIPPSFVENYSQLNPNINSREIPFPSPPITTQEDYNKGFIYRYFAKKNNEIKFIETDQENFNKFSNNNPNLATDLYSVTRVKWVISGEEQSVYNQNKSTIQQISNKLKWIGFVEYFRDNFIKYLK